MLDVIVLGAAAGGGFPQWNSNAVGCRRARAGDPMAPACTQTSVAVSGNGTDWFVLNASPDVRVQIDRTPELQPRHGLRSTPIAGVVLAGAEVDAVAGLLSLRESEAFGLYASAGVHARLDANPIFGVLQRSVVTRTILARDIACPLAGREGPPALWVTSRAVPGKVPLYAEGAEMMETDTEALEITDGTRRLLFVPGCAHVTPGLRTVLEGADCVLFDATLWQDDEMIVAGLGVKTGARMGHMSVHGSGGVLESLADVRIGRRVLIHINNSNPLLMRDSAEYAMAVAAGWDVAHDGMRLTL